MRSAAEGLELVGQPAQLIDLNCACATGHLHDALIERHFAVEGRGGIQDAVAAHHRGLDHRPDVQFDHEGNHARIGKVDPPDRTASFGKDIAKLQLDELQMR